MLTQARLKQLLRYDPDSGIFYWNVSGNGRTAGAVAGSRTISNGNEYIAISVDGKRYLAHRLAFLYMLGKFPDNITDHGDNDGTNNAWTNLADVTHTTNLQSDNIPARGVSGVRGVYWQAKARRWSACYMRHGERHYLGLFDTVAAAEQAIADHKAGKSVTIDHTPYQRR
jgi:hypothetical protein